LASSKLFSFFSPYGKVRGLFVAASTGTAPISFEAGAQGKKFSVRNHMIARAFK
jgi:hypothetical protein